MASFELHAVLSTRDGSRALAALEHDKLATAGGRRVLDCEDAYRVELLREIASKACVARADEHAPAGLPGDLDVAVAWLTRTLNKLCARAQCHSIRNGFVVGGLDGDHASGDR